MRDAKTYRDARRNDWRSLDGFTWAEHNASDGRDRYHIGSIQSTRVTARSRTIGRSRYMPHCGAKQVAKNLARAH